MSIWATLLYSFSTINYALSFCYQGIWKTKARKKNRHRVYNRKTFGIALKENYHKTCFIYPIHLTRRTWNHLSHGCHFSSAEKQQPKKNTNQMIAAMCAPRKLARILPQTNKSFHRNWKKISESHRHPNHGSVFNTIIIKKWKVSKFG